MGSSKTYPEKRWEVEMENEQRGDIGRESRRWGEGTVCVYLGIKTKKPVKCMHVCEEGEERKTGRVGRNARTEGGLL